MRRNFPEIRQYSTTTTYSLTDQSVVARGRILWYEPRAMPDARKRILDAAVELFAAHGYDGTSIREIAERADVTQPLVHHHYNSKAELLHAVVKSVTDWATERRHNLLEEIKGQPLQDRIRALVAQTFELGCSRPDYVRVLGMATYSEEIWEQADLNDLVWMAMAINIGPTVQEYMEAYPDRGVGPIVITAVGAFGAMLARALLDFGRMPPPDGMTEAEAVRRWRDRLTDNYMRVLFPGDA